MDQINPRSHPAIDTGVMPTAREGVALEPVDFTRPGWTSDFEVLDYLPSPLALRTMRAGLFGLRDAGVGTYVGLATTRPTINRGVEIGYMVSPDYRQQGYATVIAGTLVDHLTPDWRLTATVDPSNVTSQHVLERVGFVQLDDSPWGLIYGYDAGRVQR